MRLQLTRLVLLLAVVALGACAQGAQRGRDGFLRPQALGPSNGGVPRTPNRWVSAAQYQTTARGRIPAGFTAQGGRTPLPGSHLAGIANVRALVVPLSIGEAVPTITEEAIRGQYFGGPSQTGTLGDALYRESATSFRMAAEVVPVLVNPDPRFDQAAPTGAELRMLVRKALEAWAAEMDLSALDNNGPDGVPGSADDDRILDLVWVVIEGQHPFPATTIDEGFEVRSPRGRLRTGPVHVLSAQGGVLPDLRIPLDQTLASLGLGPTERFFPSGYPRTVSTLGRARLGWLPLQPVTVGEETGLQDGQALVIPLADVSAGSGFWLVERTRENVFTSRIVLRPDQSYQVTDSVSWRRGQEQVLPLSYHLGSRGQTVVVRWASSDSEPRLQGTRRATAQPATFPAPPADERVSAPVRVAGGGTAAAAGYRWVQMGSDSVRVPIAGAPLDLP